MVFIRLNKYVIVKLYICFKKNTKINFVDLFINSIFIFSFILIVTIKMNYCVVIIDVILIIDFAKYSDFHVNIN